MKKWLLSLSLSLVAATSFGQLFWSIDFDDPEYLDRIVRDTASNPNCMWQIGPPNKTVFTAAYTDPNVFVTDTLHPVPANDTSIFYLKHVREHTYPLHIFILQFRYQMDGDSTDFGSIEISPDSGNNWINVLTQDTTYQMDWAMPKPTLRGSTTDWQWFYLDMTYWASGLGSFPIEMTADTILFRFTYITDSSSTPHDGWMIDDFILEDFPEGIEEFQNDNLIAISPNPVSNQLNIHRTIASDRSRVQIIDYTGQILFDQANFSGDTIDTQHLNNGIYLLKYSDSINFAIKKLVVQH